MRRGKIQFFVKTLLSFFIALSLFAVPVEAKGSYTISPSSAPYYSSYKKKSDYSSRKHYYLLRSYLEKLEKVNGGTLTLKKGTYDIDSSLYIPSNVTIKLSSGVVINKTKSGTLFNLVAPSKKSKAMTKYSSSSNVKILGSKTCYINMKNTKSANAFMLGHNSNVEISGITFKNTKNNFIRICASKGVTIKNNTFTNSTLDKTSNKSAIYLPVADSSIKEVNVSWIKNDKTPNENIYITGNKFKYVNSAIASYKFTPGKRQNNVQIKNNTITYTYNDAIRLLNYNKPVISGNTINNVDSKNSKKRGILSSGSLYPTIKGNTFKKVGRPVQFTAAKSGTTVIYDKLSATNIKVLKETNTLDDVKEKFVRHTKKYNDYSNPVFYRIGIDSATVIDEENKVFTIGPSSFTYKDRFINYSTYTSDSKHYYLLRSYLEHLEDIGGGTLILKKGTYNIVGALYVPSNVTIQLSDGVIINKTNKTIDGLDSSSSIFQLIEPSLSSGKTKIKGYNGAHDIHIIGKGNAVIDLKYIKNSIGIVAAHNQNVKISNIHFQNMYAGHFIEMDASKNVIIEECSFTGHEDSSGNNKEAINIDTPDKNTGGLNIKWTSYDCTPNADVVIRNNTFTALERAIGTHKYSDNKLHSNIQILNNTISDCDQDAIRVMNWKDPVISENTIANLPINSKTYRGILMSGVHNPTITNNTFKSMVRPAQIIVWSNGGTDMNYSGADNYPAIVSTLTDQNIEDFKTNILIDTQENFLRFNNGELGDYSHQIRYPMTNE